MTAALIVHPLAGDEIDRVRSWYEEIQFGLGAEFVRCLAECFERIRRNPMMYVEVGGGLHRAILRRFPYHVIYSVDGDRIWVLAFFHDHTDPRKIKTQLLTRNPIQ